MCRLMYLHVIIMIYDGQLPPYLVCVCVQVHDEAYTDNCAAHKCNRVGINTASEKKTYLFIIIIHGM